MGLLGSCSCVARRDRTPCCQSRHHNGLSARKQGLSSGSLHRDLQIFEYKESEYPKIYVSAPRSVSRCQGGSTASASVALTGVVDLDLSLSGYPWSIDSNQSKVHKIQYSITFFEDTSAGGWNWRARFSRAVVGVDVLLFLLCVVVVFYKLFISCYM